MPFLGGYSGEYEGYTRLKLIQKILRGLGSPVTTYGTDTTADYSRYPKEDIVDKLIEGQVDFARKTNCLTTFAIIEGVASQAEYRLPRICLKVLDAKYYTGTSEYEQLEILSDKSKLKRISNSWKTDGAGTPEYLYPSYNYGNIKKIGLYAKPSSSGTTYTGTTMGVVTSATDFTFNGNVTGTHKTGFDNSAFLVDADGRDFTTLGIVVGMMIFNTTQGGKGQITAIGDQDATNDKLSVTLDSGDFDVGDSFEVTLGDYGVLIRATGAEEWAFSSDYGALQDITPLSNNLLLDIVRRPLSLDYDTMIPEIPMDYHQALVEYAVWKLGGTEYDGQVAQKRSEQGQQAWLGYLQDYKDQGKLDVETDNTIEDREGMMYE